VQPIPHRAFRDTEVRRDHRHPLAGVEAGDDLVEIRRCCHRCTIGPPLMPADCVDTSAFGMLNVT
jgi:hypothetical protein